MNKDRERRMAEKSREAQGIDPAKACFRPTEDRAWNPLTAYPRNDPCYCGSGTKFKKCCYLTQTRTISKAAAERLAPQVKQAQAEREWKKQISLQKTS